MLNIWCVLWIAEDRKPFFYSTRPADRPKPDKQESRLYTEQDVIKFERMLRRSLPEARFRCLANVEIPGIEVVPLLDKSLIAWWAKMECFRPDLQEEQASSVYFDLDVLLIRDLGPIVNFDAPFSAIRPGPGVGSADQNDPHAPEPWKRWQDQEGKWRVPKYQTSVMTWRGDYVTKFWDKFQANKADYLKRLASDQDFLGEQFPDEARMPTEWFRKMPKNGTKPIKPRMVVMTMPMRNDEAARQYEWVRQIWN